MRDKVKVKFISGGKDFAEILCTDRRNIFYGTER